MNSPSLYELQQWPLEEQSSWLTTHGTYISWKSEGQYNIYLYKLDEHFAEAWMNINLGKIIKINFSNSRNLPGGYDQSVVIK